MNSLRVTQLSKRVSPSAVLDMQISFCVKLIIGRKILYIKTGKYAHQTWNLNRMFNFSWHSFKKVLVIFQLIQVLDLVHFPPSLLQNLKRVKVWFSASVCPYRLTLYEISLQLKQQNTAQDICYSLLFDASLKPLLHVSFISECCAKTWEK